MSIPGEKLQQRFMDLLSKKLASGSVELGDKSFFRPIPELVGEMEEELVDIAGWTFVAWVRLKLRLKNAEQIEAIESMDPDRLKQLKHQRWELDREIEKLEQMEGIR